MHDFFKTSVEYLVLLHVITGDDKVFYKKLPSFGREMRHRVL